MGARSLNSAPYTVLCGGARSPFGVLCNSSENPLIGITRNAIIKIIAENADEQKKHLGGKPVSMEGKDKTPI